MVLGSCSDGDDDRSIDVVRLFSSDSVIAAGREQRLPLGLVDNGAPLVDDATMMVVVRSGDRVIDELEVPSRIVSHDHPDGTGDTPHEHADLLRYFPVRTTLPDPGIYDLDVEVGGQRTSVPVQAFAPESISVLLAGERFPPLATPTLDDPAPMDPICTLFDGPCPFHTRTVADVLSAGEPLAFLIASPAYCATSYCGPVLDVMIEASASFPSVVPLHLEVYENPNAVGGNIADPSIRPVAAFADLGLDFEPALFLVDRDGLLVERIDNVFDRGELERAMATIA